MEETMRFLEPTDIVERLCRSKPYWLDGPPIVKLKGRNGKFGRLFFEFPDDIICYKIKILNRNQILAIANEAITNFTKYAKELK